jgi:hypothetical protein
MNEIVESWSLPWHALQRNLARDNGAAALRNIAPALKAVPLRGFAISTRSWLSRVQNPSQSKPQP